MDSNEVVVHIDETLARYSDLLFGTAITVYVLAMFLFLWALGSARIRRIQSAEARQLVGAVAGGTSSGVPDLTKPGKLEAAPKRPFSEKLAAMAYPVVIVGVIACMLAHTIEIWGFAVAYWLLHFTPLDMGFSDEVRRTFLDYLNFSAESYTSLGFGDAELLTPNMRLLAGIEALAGLVLIAWSASFTYFVMAQYWGGRPRH